MSSIPRRIIKNFNLAKKKFFDHIFNTKLTCNICGDELFTEGYFCEDCEQSLVRNEGSTCDCCGRKTNIPTLKCTSCKGEWEVDKARSVFIYKDGAVQLIHSLKYGRRRYLAEIIAPYMKNVYVKNLFAPDIITYVPMTPSRQRKRGFNQSKDLAVALGKLVDNEVIGLLSKDKDTVQQQKLSYAERKKNLLGSFSIVDKSLVKGKKILLVDDVMTTGATSNAIAKKLKKAGAKSVYLLTVASTELKGGF